MRFSEAEGSFDDCAALMFSAAAKRKILQPDDELNFVVHQATPP
jgi:hypothetical protein